MAFADDFSSSSLDPKWTLEAGTPAATLLMLGGEARITAKPGAAYQAPSQSSSTDTSYGIAISAADAGAASNFDIAVQAPTSLLSKVDNGWGVAVYGATRTSDHVVVEQRRSGTSFFVRVLSRVGGSLTTHVNDVGNWGGTSRYRGFQFIRIARSANSWTVYGSFNGASWTTLASFSASFTVDSVKVFGSVFSVNLGQTLRISETYDVTGTDLRAAAGTLSGDTTWTTDFTSGIPSWLVDESGNGGSLSVVSNQLNMDKTTAFESHAMVRNDTKVSDVEMLVKFRIDSTENNGNNSQFMVLGLSGTRKADQYSLHRSHILEIAEAPGPNTIPLRVHVRNRDQGNFNAVYDFGPSMTVSGWGNDVWCWARFQRIGNRIRFRGWADGDTEPSTWSYDAHDEMWDDPGYAFATWGSNSTEVAATTLLVDELTIRGVEATPGSVDEVNALPGLIGRWRSDSLDGLADLADVEGWYDSSDFGLSLWRGSSDSPVFHHNEVNGFPAVKFDGLGAQRLFSARTSTQDLSVIVGDMSAVTWVLIGRSTTTSGTRVILDGFADGERNAVFHNTTWNYYADSTVINSGDSVDLNNHVVTTSFAATRADSKQYLDGAEIGTGNPGASILDRAVIGSEDNGANPANFYVAEILLFASELNASQLATVHSYVQDRYGITVSDYSPKAIGWGIQM